MSIFFLNDRDKQSDDRHGIRSGAGIMSLFTMYIIFLEKLVDYNGRCHKVPVNKRSLWIKYMLRDRHPIIMAVVLLNKSRGSRGSGLEPLFKELPFRPSWAQRCGLSDMLSFFSFFFLGCGEGGGGEAKQ